MSIVLRLIRWLARVPGVRRLTEVDALMRVSLSLRSSLVRKPWRFAWNELRPGQAVTAVYRLKDSGIAVTIRHKSPDIFVLDEMFSQQEYRFPESIRSRLAQAGQLKVADVGANIGLFGAWLLGHFPDAEILAFEPDPRNAERHRRTIEANGRAATWRLLEAVAMTEGGTIRFAIGEFATSHVARTDETGIEVEAVDVFPWIADADLVKIDIEGAEWPILRDRRFRELSAAAVVLEYHPEGALAPDAAQAAEDLLAEAGFLVVARHPKDVGTGVLWALGPA